MDSNNRILLTGGAGFLGSEVVDQLVSTGFPRENITCPRSAEFDLRDANICNDLVAKHDIIIHLAAKVGGIGFNQKFPGELFYDNITMGINLIEQSRINKVKKFVFVGTTCSYPKFCPIPFKEETLWDGFPEETNAPYGIAKKALGTMLESYHQQYDFPCAYLIPVNLYGPRDSFHLEHSHVIPALIRKFTAARESGEKSVTLWGDGSPTREFLFVRDAARGIVLAVQNISEPIPINLGSSEEIAIEKLAELLKDMIGFSGEIIWDTSKPNGQPRRKLDISRAKEIFEYSGETSFQDGLRETIAWWEAHKGEF